jgi:hypothetical protein
LRERERDEKCVRGGTFNHVSVRLITCLEQYTRERNIRRIQSNYVYHITDTVMGDRVKYAPVRKKKPSGAHKSGYGEWHPRGTRATQCLGV